MKVNDMNLPETCEFCTHMKSGHCGNQYSPNYSADMHYDDSCKWWVSCAKQLEFGEAIRKRRIRKHLSQYQLAEKAYCNQQTISRIEHGGSPTVGVLASVLNALGLDLKVVDNERYLF